MNSNPTVCAIMLVNGRPEMVARAVRSFREQTYQNKRLLIWDTGELNQDFDTCEEGDGLVAHVPAEAYRDPAPTIGALRNEANAFWTDYPILIHWDSDDWAHPRRIEEQVALLQASGKEAVGYRDMLFWQEPTRKINRVYEPSPTMEESIFGQVWLYTNGNTKYCLGTSLCYWRRVWERRPFEDLPKGPTGEGEDSRWLREVDSLGVACVAAQDEGDGDLMDQPRMIASVHGGNTSSMVALAIRRQASEVKRVPEWDSYCRERMKL